MSNRDQQRKIREGSRCYGIVGAEEDHGLCFSFFSSLVRVGSWHRGWRGKNCHKKEFEHEKLQKFYRNSSKEFLAKPRFDPSVGSSRGCRGDGRLLGGRRQS